MRTIYNEKVVVVIGMYNGKEYKGIAKCSPDDEFNFETGLKIARCRAERKIAKAKLKFYKQKINELLPELNKLEYQALQAFEDYWDLGAMLEEIIT